MLVTGLTECEALPVRFVPTSRAAPISNTVGGSGKHDFKGGALKWRVCVSGYEEWTKGPAGGRGGKARGWLPSGRGLLRRKGRKFSLQSCCCGCCEPLTAREPQQARQLIVWSGDFCTHLGGQAEQPVSLPVFQILSEQVTTGHSRSQHTPKQAGARHSRSQRAPVSGRRSKIAVCRQTDFAT